MVNLPYKNMSLPSNPFFSEFKKSAPQIFLNEGEALLKSPPKFSRQMPWGPIPKLLEEDSSFRHQDFKPRKYLHTEGLNDGERGVWIIRNEKLKYNRYVFTDEKKEVFFEMILSDEIRSVMKTIGFAKLRNFIKSKIGPEHHGVISENIDPESNDLQSNMLRVIGSMGNEFEKIVGSKVAMKATGRVARFSNMRKEHLFEQYLFMRELSQIVKAKPIPGFIICPQYAYFRFPKASPTEGEDLEYILMRQVSGKNIDFKKMMLVYVGRKDDSEDLDSYEIKFSENPAVKQIVEFIYEDKKNKDLEHPWRYEYKMDHISAGELRVLIEEYLGIRYSSKAVNLRDFAPRNILSVLNSNGIQNEIVVIDQHPHHRR